MPSIATEGIILKRNNFGEADRILTVFTKRFGKISVVARGVRKITSRRAGNIEVLNKVKLYLFKSPRSYTLTEAESVETFSRLKENLTLSTTAFHIIELVDRLTAENQVNSQLYELILGVLSILESNPRQIFVRGFEVKILTLMGFWSIEAIDDVEPSLRVILQKLEFESWENINQIKLTEDQALALERILRYYLEKVLEGKLKSIKVFKRNS